MLWLQSGRRDGRVEPAFGAHQRDDAAGGERYRTDTYLVG